MAGRQTSLKMFSTSVSAGSSSEKPPASTTALDMGKGEPKKGGAAAPAADAPAKGDKKAPAKGGKDAPAGGAKDAKGGKKGGKK